MMKKLICIILTAVMVMALAVPVFAEDPVIEADNGSATNDVEVGYTYTAGTDTAAKHFYVTLAFTLPTTLEYDGGVAAYKWNPATGAYEADTANDVAGEGALADDGAFEIVITNQSNVGITYTVEYTADTSAIFATEAADDWANAEGTVDTVAKGQEIDDTGITITNVTEATTGDTSFKSATCTGSITVTGINEGKTPGESGTDKLGTFKVTITEGEIASDDDDDDEDPLALGNKVVEGMTVKTIAIGPEVFTGKEDSQISNILGYLSEFASNPDPETVVARVLKNSYGINLDSFKTLEVGDNIPAGQFLQITYGDYIFCNNTDVNFSGFRVSVVDNTKTTYQDIPTSISGIPVVSLNCAFRSCGYMTTIPALPKTVTDYSDAFEGCINITSVDEPLYVDGANVFAMFGGCTKLSGEIELIGTPSTDSNMHKYMFSGAGSDGDGIVIFGTCDSGVLADIAGFSDYVTDTFALGNTVVEGMTVEAMRIDWGDLAAELRETAMMEYNNYKMLGNMDAYYAKYPQVTIEEPTFNVGDSIPTDGDCEITYGDYIYKLREAWTDNAGVEYPKGWSVTVVDKTKTSYEDIRTSIAGLPVVSLERTFQNCSNMTVAPAIPGTVKNYYFTFSGCTSLTTVNSPLNIDGANFESAFDTCISLKGEIALNGTPHAYGWAFADAGSEDGVVLSGTCDSGVLAQMAGKGAHVSVKGN